jgi:Cellulase (glycosyl hydrolase family 5)
MRYLVILCAALMLVGSADAQKKAAPPGEQWSKERAAKWYKDQSWPVGCNYLPSTAINQLEMWQKETWDPKTIDRELGWAADLGFTSMRVFLHDLPHTADSSGFINRIDAFLKIADKHRIKPMFVFFDSCWHPEPKLGKQPEPTPHLHNSGWVQSPGVAVLKDADEFAKRETYVKSILRAFKNDRRILCWDLWNEPDNNNASSYGEKDLKDKAKIVLPLVQQVFAWARAIDPSQPITAAPWQGDWTDEAKLTPLDRFLFDNSDIITFHRYENLDRTKKQAEALKRYERPILCSEFMARPIGSKFETHLPYFQENTIGAFCWGFVSGKSQTIYPWDSWQKKYDAEPKAWFHDILRADGKPYDEKEVKLIKQVTSKRLDVRLRISVEELDPLKPGNAFLECTVRNGTATAVTAPSVFDGNWISDVKLTAFRGPEAGLAWIPMNLHYWATDKKKETKLLQPGEELTVFKDELKAILILDANKDKPVAPKQKRYYWLWTA